MNTKVIILRGASGVGKSTYAGHLGSACTRPTVTVSADAYPGLYDDDMNIDYALLGPAHDACFDTFSRTCAMTAAGDMEPELIIVDNTNTQLWEMAPYRMVARRHGIEVQFMEVVSTRTAEELARRSVHGAPVAAIEGMLARMEPVPPFWGDTSLRVNTALRRAPWPADAETGSGSSNREKTAT